MYGILSIALIPVVHFSVLWWRDVHQPPTLLRPDEMQMDGILLGAFFAGLVAYAVVAAALIVRRYRLGAAEAELERRLRHGAGAIAGDAVSGSAAGAQDMSGWGWVVWGYGVVGVVLAAYVVSLTTRLRNVRRRLDELD